MIEIKAKKLDTGYAFHDALTNDPIAIATDISRARDKTKRYSMAWHPDAIAMHPETQHLVNMNFGNVNGLQEAKDMASNKYSAVLDGTKRDPIQTTYAGISSKTDKIGETMHYDDFHIHHEGKHIATLHVNKNKTFSIGTNSSSYQFDGRQHNFNPKYHAFVEFHGDVPTPDKFKVSQLKHPGVDPITLLHQVKHWVDNKDKEPKFVGHYSMDNLKAFKTTLSPEQASSAYMQHLQDSGLYDNHKFTKLTPTVFQATYTPESQHSYGKHELIDSSEQGILKHYSIETGGEHHYKSTKNTEVIE